MTNKKKEKLSPRQLFIALAKTVRLAVSANPRAMITLTSIQIIASTLPAINAIVAGLLISSLAEAIATQYATPFFIILAISTLINLTTFALNSVIGYFNTKIGFDVENYTHTKLLAKYTKVPLAQRENKEFADSFERAEDFARSLEWTFNRVVSMITNIVAFVAAFIAMAVVSWWLALVIVVALIPNFVIVYRSIQMEREKWVGNSVNRRKAWRYRTNLIDPNKTIELRINGLNDYFVKMWKWLDLRDRDATMKVERKFLPLHIGVNVIDTTVGAGALIWIGWQIIRGALPIGQFVSFQALMGNLNASGRGVLWDISYISKDLFNSVDFFKFVEMPDPVVGEHKLAKSDTPPKIELCDVTFTYPLADQPALKNISMTINPGDDIALVGENGSGKTTLVKIILGLYEPDSGQVLVDDTPLSRVDLTDYYHRVGALFQEFARYDFATLAENIWFGDIEKKSDQEAFLKALEQAKLAELPTKLEKGFDQVLSKDIDEDSGVDLSGGQWQRLALARGFFRSPDILILDEPTAAVDARAEYEIFRAIAANQELKTTIIISHRFSTVRRARKIFVIADGQIVESGTHGELMKTGGLYSEMFELQAEGYR